MTRIILKRKKQVKEPNQPTKVSSPNEVKPQQKTKSGWSLDEVFSAKDITPSKNWKWSGNTFTNEKQD